MAERNPWTAAEEPLSVDDFFTRLNPLICGVLRSPVHWLLSPGLMLLTFTGRKTGRRYAIPVGYQRDGERTLTVMISEAPKKQWWRNYREPGPVEVRLRGRDRRGTAQLVAPGSDELIRLAATTLGRVPGLGRAWGIRYDRRRGLTPEQTETLRRTIAAVRIELEEESDLTSE